jgi:acyl carrier protein
MCSRNARTVQRLWSVQNCQKSFDQLSADSRLEVIGVESLDVIEIIFSLEEKYKIEIPFNANEFAPTAFETIGQVADAVRKQVGPKPSS